MGSMTRLGQGVTLLENLVNGKHISSMRISRNGLHDSRISRSNVHRFEKQKGPSKVSIQVQVNNVGILKPDLPWSLNRPRRVLQVRASVADAGAGEFSEGLGNEAASAVETVKELPKNGGMRGMADAFDISPRTAFGVTACIAVAALVLPLYMPSSGVGMALKTRGLSYLTLLLGFYMAWNIGANDVANAMGTSVGSGALTLRQAVMTAAVLEFSGAFTVGSHVSHTMQSGILSANVFAGKETLMFCGMLSSLGAAGTWLQVSAYLQFENSDFRTSAP